MKSYMCKSIFFALACIYFTNFVPIVWSYKSSANCRCGITAKSFFTPKVIGGKPAIPHEFPWQVLILKNLYPICGGCLLNDRYVLTAAHCLLKASPKIITVLLGEHNFLNPHQPHFHFFVSKLIVHPKYNSKIYSNDIGLVKLEGYINANIMMTPPCFPRPDLNYTKITAYAAGWGRIGNDKNSPMSSVLLKTTLMILSTYECRLAFGMNLIMSSMICAGWEFGVRDTCHGDSGSPLVTERGGRWYLVGLVSWGYGCGGGIPGVYTRVDKFYNWLDRNTNDAFYCTF